MEDSPLKQREQETGIIKTVGPKIPKIRKILKSEVKNDVVYYYDVKMKKVLELGEGESFGGMNIDDLGDGGIGMRMAAILCEEDSEFLILERTNYIVSELKWPGLTLRNSSGESKRFK